MAQIVIIADDLTGAADTAVGFAKAGLLTLVAANPPGAGSLRVRMRRPGRMHPTASAELQAPQGGALPGSASSAGTTRPACDVLAVSTESRDVSRDEAVARTKKICLELFGAAGVSMSRPAIVYKKMDSTLRGHPAAELAAVMDVLGAERALVAPAFPEQGRTTVGGRQRVDGVPLEQTAFAREAGSSDLRTMFQEEGFRNEKGTGPAILVADAESDADLERLAREALACETRVFCGSAGLARALVKVMGLKPAVPEEKGVRHLLCEAPGGPFRQKVPDPFFLPGGPILVVAGSRHPRTARQVQFAQGAGMAVVRPSQAFLMGGEGRGPVEDMEGHLKAGRDVILTTLGMDDSPLGARGVAALLGRAVRAVAERHRPGGLVLTGGDVAVAVCAGLQAKFLRLLGEVQPGIPWGTLLEGILPGLPIVTKAGGFGSDEVLVKAVQRLRAHATQIVF